MTTDVLKRLGLSGHPFGPPFRQPLRPQAECDLAVYARVEGFGEQVVTIDNWFVAPENHIDGQTATVLVYGPKRTGRSSVAQYIHRKYCLSIRNIEESPLQLLANIDDSDPLIPIQSLMAKLHDILQNAVPSLSRTDSALDKLFELHCYSDSPAPLRQYERIFSRALSRINAKSLVILAENVDAYEQISNVRAVFDSIPLLIFTTSKEDVFHKFYREQIHGFSITLSSLTVKDIAGFVQQRWQAYSSSVPPPFSSDILESSFGSSRKWAFKGVVGVISEVYSVYIDAVQSGKYNDQSGIPQIPTRTIEMWFRDAMERLGLITYNSDES